MLVLAPAAALSGAADAAKHKPSTVKAPSTGKYKGFTAERLELTLYISGDSVELVAFGFKCGDAVGRTSLNDIMLRKSTGGYKFAIRAYGSVTFSDNRPDENAAFDIRGRFSRSAKTVTGLFRAKVPRCPDTRAVRWSARRR